MRLSSVPSPSWCYSWFILLSQLPIINNVLEWHSESPGSRRQAPAMCLLPLGSHINQSIQVWTEVQQNWAVQWAVFPGSTSEEGKKPMSLVVFRFFQADMTPAWAKWPGAIDSWLMQKGLSILKFIHHKNRDWPTEGQMLRAAWTTQRLASHTTVKGVYIPHRSY